ncbi:NifB/NifX family molybdenum-iron cluster-binding protein [Magnetofaba australis]|nr:NifB/NifX family molybdenum-iron cluster-binding protein [Magnetofaba australis]
MKVAITSQNRKSVTQHAGKCRNYWLYTVEAGVVVNKELLELPMGQAFHDWPHGQPHPIDGVDLYITASVGQGLRNRLAQNGTHVVITEQTDLELALEEGLASLAAE